MPRNRSSAVMQQRFSFAADDPDHYPTPCWATRALIEHVLLGTVRGQTCLEPACGAGDMARPLARVLARSKSYGCFRLRLRRDPRFSDLVMGSSYCWLLWRKGAPPADTILRWIPPCRRMLEKGGDYPVTEDLV